jgi:hypothetical protein
VNRRTADVYTCWFGVAYDSRRLIFHTLLPRHGAPCLVWGWATEPDAILGHRLVCDWLSGTGPMPARLLAGSREPDPRTRHAAT